MLHKVNLSKEAHSIEELYVYKKVGVLNNNIFSIVNVENRILDFHIHEKSDELFYVIEGSFKLETEEGLMDVNEGEFAIVPKGTLHRPVVGKMTRFMMIELEGTLNKENSGELYDE